jgi:hypothetical protein
MVAWVLPNGFTGYFNSKNRKKPDVLGQTDTNFLSHDNPARLDITFDQAKDFVSGVRNLTKRCEGQKLIKGR